MLQIPGVVPQDADLEGAGQRDVVEISDMIPVATGERLHRAWGYFEMLSLGDRFQVRRVMVSPGERLSLQSHLHRAEHWVVVSGSARVTIGEEASLISENESTFIPLGAVHRLENPGKLPLHLIEVQSGCYLGEDDIVLHEDRQEVIEVA